MKNLVTAILMFFVSIFCDELSGQTPHLKADRVGDVYSSETWGRSHDVPPFVTTKDRITCLWVESEPAKSIHDVPIVCGKGDGKCGVKDCKCSCHNKDAKKKDHKRGHSRDHKRDHQGDHQGDHKRGHTSSRKKPEVQSTSPKPTRGPGSHRPGPVRPSAISETLRKRLGEAVKEGKMSREKAAEAYKKYADRVKQNTPTARKTRSDAIRKRVEEWRKNYGEKKDHGSKTRTRKSA